jgi:hypothetical protein
MATITGLTAARMLEIEAASVVDGAVVGDDLFLTRKDGSLVNAGHVRGIPGPEGPIGHPLSVISAQRVLDVGVPNQIRAGRQLTPADFTNMGLVAPIGLWNLSNVSDASGNGRNLTNKGSVPFGLGINGVAATAAQFAGSTSQALYIADSGAADPFRIRTGSWGAWFRSARKATQVAIISKLATAAGNHAWEMYVSPSANALGAAISIDGTAIVATVLGSSDVLDDRWHFGVVTYDGSKARLYVDGVLEASGNIGNGGPIFSGNAPLNIGGRGGAAAVATQLPNFGRIDEAFVTSDVLSDDQVRNLYCASIPHALGSIPMMTNVSIRRRRRGGVFAATDFPAQPSRLYNFIGGALTDEGSNNIPFTWTGPNGSTVAGADGSRSSAVRVVGSSHLAASDAGLPAGLSSRSYGCWFKTTVQNAAIMGWGAYSSGHTLMYMTNSAGGPIGVQTVADNIVGPAVADGLWHFAVVVEDNTAIDGVKRKLYVDGKFVVGSTVMPSMTLGGANRFRIGEVPTGGPLIPYTGDIDGAFVFNGALTVEQIRSLYDVGSQQLASGPKNSADFVKAREAARLLTLFDGVETVDLADISVM